jgi:hypothetical protein
MGLPRSRPSVLALSLSLAVTISRRASRCIAHWNHPKYSPECPVCGDPSKTANGHFLLCSPPSRIQWCKVFLSAFVQELHHLHIALSLTEFLKTTVDYLFPGRIISVTDPSVMPCYEPRRDWLDVKFLRLLEPRVAYC